MSEEKSLGSSITGSISSAVPILFACCKSGACIGVCASPVASLFGISSASLASSPWIGVLEPVLIAASAVSFTISYYSLYVLPKASCATECSCGPDNKEIRRRKISKAVFWTGLMLSLGFLSFFEVQKFRNANSVNSECSASSCLPGECE
jgi:hypothetical protein